MAEKAAWEQGIENKTTLIPIVVLQLQHESGEPTMKESGDHDEIVGEYNVNFGRENNSPSGERYATLPFSWDEGLILPLSAWKPQSSKCQSK